MEEYIQQFSQKVISLLRNLPKVEIAKAIDILQAAFERDGRIYIRRNSCIRSISSRRSTHVLMITRMNVIAGSRAGECSFERNANTT